MKRWLAVFMVVLLLAACGVSSGSAPIAPVQSSSVLAQSSANEALVSASDAPVPIPPAAQPMLVTSLGQSTDGLLVREILNSLSAEFDFEQTISSGGIGEYKTLIFAIGASTKALGGKGISVADELSRCQTLLEATTPEQYVVMVRLGDWKNQDELTAKLINLSLPYVDAVFIVENSDRDGVMTKYAAEHGLILKKAQTVKKMADLFEAMLNGTLTK